MLALNSRQRIVTPGLDPGVHLFRRVMDGRVKPGHDLVGD
jgi:hypothetical protein